MEVVLGIIIGALVLLMAFVLVAQVVLGFKVKAVQIRQESLNRELNIAKDQYQRRMENNNKEIAKELDKIHRDSTCFVGINQRIGVSELLFKFMGNLGYDVLGRNFEIIKKGDQGSYGKEREKTECSKSKKKES